MQLFAENLRWDISEIIVSILHSEVTLTPRFSEVPGEPIKRKTALAVCTALAKPLKRFPSGSPSMHRAEARC
jgi:hypothetical protein